MTRPLMGTGMGSPVDVFGLVGCGLVVMVGVVVPGMLLVLVPVLVPPPVVVVVGALFT
jgi:hypothetical protein